MRCSVNMLYQYCFFLSARNAWQEKNWERNAVAALAIKNVGTHYAMKLIPCLLKHTWHDLDAWQIMLTSWVFNAADWTKQTCCSKSHKPYVSRKKFNKNKKLKLKKKHSKTGENKKKKTWKSCQPSTSRTYSDTVIILCLPRVMMFTLDVTAAFLLSPKPHWATPFPRMRKAHHSGWSTLRRNFSRFPALRSDTI